MDLKTKQNQLEAKRKEIIFLRLVVLILSGTTLILGLLVWYSIMHAKTIIVPAYFNQKAAISESAVSPAYLTDITESLIFDRYNVTPQDVDAMHSLLLPYVVPSFLPTFSKLLNEEAGDIKTQMLTAAFYIDNISVDANNLKVSVTGTLKESSGMISVGSNSLPDQQKTFLLQYQYTNGLLQLTNWIEVAKNE